MSCAAGPAVCAGRWRFAAGRAGGAASASGPRCSPGWRSRGVAASERAVPMVYELQITE